MYKKEFEETDNSVVYRRCRNIHLAKEHGFCEYCSPNRGCNRRARGSERNWKRFRKTQYKAVDICIQPIDQHFQDLFDAGLISRDLMECLSACRPTADVLEEISKE